MIFDFSIHRFFFILSILFILIINSFSQLPQNTISLSGGISDFHMKDERISDVIFRGDLYNIRSSYNHITENYIHDVKIDIGIGKVESIIKEYDVSQYNGEISYTLFKFIKQVSNNSFNSFAGLGINSSFLTSYILTPGYITNFCEWTWYWKNSLDISLLEKINLYKNNFLEVCINIPVIKFITRPEYSNNVINNDPNIYHALKRSKFSFLTNNFVIGSEIVYRNVISSKFDLHLIYNFNYASTINPVNMEMFSNNFTAGVTWKF